MSVALILKELKVRSLDVDFNEVSWQLANTLEDVYDYTFQVLRSEGPEGPFHPVSPEMQDQYLFVDNDIPRRNDLRSLYYKVVIRQKRTGEFTEFGPASHGPEADLVAAELRKHMNLLFTEFVGRRCWVLPVRTFGTRCAECWNHTLSKRTKSMCLACYDTSYAGGFLRPIESWMSIDPTMKAKQQSSVGPQAQQDTTARLGYWPPLKPNDVIVEAENIRWRVNYTTTTQQLRAAVHQEVNLHRINSGDIEYRYQLDLGTALTNLSLIPARQRTNPHNLESYEQGEFADVLALYPTGTRS